MANAKLKDRQMTCGDPECQREWHRKKCKEWNKNNSECFRANYLQKKLDTAAQSAKASKPNQAQTDTLWPVRSHMSIGLPLDVVQEVISIQQVVIIEYLGQLLVRRFQEVLRRQLIVNTRKVSQLSPMASSRSDRL